MPSPDNLLVACGLYHITLGIFHLFFPRLFKWNEPGSTGSFANDAIIRIFNALFIFLFFLTGFSQVFHSIVWEPPTETALALTAALFWSLRLILQFIYLKRNHWLIHSLSLFFLLGTVLHFLLFLSVSS